MLRVLPDHPLPAGSCDWWETIGPQAEHPVGPFDYEDVRKNLETIRVKDSHLCLLFYKKLSEPNVEDAVLRASLDVLANSSVSDTREAILKCAAVMGFDKSDNKTQDIFFYRTDAKCSGNGKDTRTNTFVRIHISLFRDAHGGPSVAVYFSPQLAISAQGMKMQASCS